RTFLGRTEKQGQSLRLPRPAVARCLRDIARPGFFSIRLPNQPERHVLCAAAIVPRNALIRLNIGRDDRAKTPIESFTSAPPFRKDSVLSLYRAPTFSRPLDWREPARAALCGLRSPGKSAIESLPSPTRHVRSSLAPVHTDAPHAAGRNGARSPDEAGLDPLAGLADVTRGRRFAVSEHHAVPGGPQPVGARPAGSGRGRAAARGKRPVGRFDVRGGDRAQAVRAHDRLAA